eukprot:TRINITY_DN998_c8_g1_i1.p1 TRINITY_DN998_c8_g1~~TRINITY_DN998_c8_g1_i1.p1  ORF type:complete len:345 (+),score=101.26 TRINITY_DN998_c8_g1_i1:69-1103(+)
MGDACKAGVEKFTSGDCAGALELFTTAIEHADSDVQRVSALMNRCACYLQLEKGEQAYADACRSVELRPKSVKALGWRAQAEMKLGRFDDCVSTCSVALKRAAKLQKRDEVRLLEELKSTSEKMLALRSSTCPQGDAKSEQQKGAAALSDRKYEDADRHFTKALGLDPGMVSAYSGRSASRVEQCDYDGALADADRCVALAPDDVRGYVRRVNALFSGGNYGDALEACKHIPTESEKDEVLVRELRKRCEKELEYSPEEQRHMHRLRADQRMRAGALRSVKRHSGVLGLGDSLDFGPEPSDKELRVRAVRLAAEEQEKREQEKEDDEDACETQPKGADEVQFLD